MALKFDHCLEIWSILVIRLKAILIDIHNRHIKIDPSGSMLAFPSLTNQCK